MSNWRNAKLKKLAKAFLCLKSEKDVENFLRDLCTLEELEELSGRWEVAEMLNKGVSYRDIAEKTGVSTTTITRVAHWLEYGEGGYKIALKKGKKKPTK
ncbi:MAG: YerC/YecD family TrpR-related protein [Candidatus Magasanikbacteria bacterium]